MVVQVVSAPFVVVVDGREKKPYTFDGLKADAGLGGGDFFVRWEWTHLPSGDYSIQGYEDRVSIERKTLGDLYTTLGQYRKRFQREMERLSTFDFAAVVIESSWDEILLHPPEESDLRPKTVFRTAIAWTQRYGVPWMAFDNRRLAEVATFRMLERWWRDFKEAEAEPGEFCRYCGRPLEDPRSRDCGMGPWCRKRKVRDLLSS